MFYFDKGFYMGMILGKQNGQTGKSLENPLKLLKKFRVGGGGGSKNLGTVE